MFSWVLIASALLWTVHGQGGSQQTSSSPRLLTTPRRFSAREGEAVTLPCQVINLGRGSVFWLKGDTPESRELVLRIHGTRRRPVPARRYLQDIRAGKLSMAGNNLIINNLSVGDAGVYTCTATWAGQSVTHVLEVTASPQEMTLEYFPPNKSMTVTVGNTVTFACRTRGSPQPSVTWYREGSEGEVVSQGPVLVLQEARREDEGRYMCVARDAAGRRHGTSFTLHVQYLSVRAAQERVVVRSEDPRARLTCYVEGYPEPQVLWYSDSGRVEEDATHRVEARGNVHHLQIEEVTRGDLGEYQCYAHNAASRDLATTTLSAVPGEARILGVEATALPNTYNVTWTLQSLAPLRLYLMEYSQEGSAADQWQSTFIGASTLPRGLTYTQSGQVTLDPAYSYYKVRIRGVTQDNEQGSLMTQPYVFATGGDGGQSSGSVTGALRTSLPILSRLPALARIVF